MSELDVAIKRFRRARAQRERSTALQLRQAYLTARNSLGTQLDSMTAWMESERAAGREVPLWRVLAEARTRNLLFQAEAAFTRYSREVGQTIQHEQRQAVMQAQTDARDLIETGFGPGPVGVGIPFVALPQQAISQFVATTQPDAPVRKLLDEFGGQAAATVENELITGIASGRGPRQTARAISSALGGQYDRALLITRTETLRAYRGAHQAIYEENAHLLEGWIWHASLSERTCAACWAMHGTLHPVTEPMSEHPAGRCSMLPRTKSWQDLGYDVPDERPEIEPGVDVFNRLSPEKQLQTLGPKAYKAFTSGQIGLADLVNVRESGTWGTTRSVGSTDGALARAASRKTIAAVKVRPAALPPDAHREFSYDPDAFKVYRKKQYDEWATGASADDITAFRQYKSARYQSVNKYLRTGQASGGNTASELDQFVKTLDKGLKRATLDQDVVVHRGIAADPFNIPKRYSDLRPGSIMTDKGYVSTSTTKAAEKFAPKRRGSYLLEIKVPKGSRGLNLDPLGDAQTRNEGEILLPRGSKFLVKSVTEERNGRTRIVAELVS